MVPGGGGRRRDHIGQFARDIQQAAAVVAQIEHQVVDRSRLELFHRGDQLRLGRCVVRVELQVADLATRRRDGPDVPHRGVGDQRRGEGRAELAGVVALEAEVVLLAGAGRARPALSRAVSVPLMASMPSTSSTPSPRATPAAAAGEPGSV